MTNTNVGRSEGERELAHDPPSVSVWPFPPHPTPHPPQPHLHTSLDQKALQTGDVMLYQ